MPVLLEACLGLVEKTARRATNRKAYEFVKPLRAAIFGGVFAARSVATSQEYAIKVGAAGALDVEVLCDLCPVMLVNNVCRWRCLL